ncbi:MAG: AAA family ATPase [Thermomicrobiales bacterium]
MDTDYGDWKVPGPGGDLIRDEPRIDRLLIGVPGDRHLAVDGCVSNQGRFYDRFDFIILLTAPIEVMLERVTQETTNDYGKTETQQAEIRANKELVEPQLRFRADMEIDTSVESIEDVAARIIALAQDDE